MRPSLGILQSLRRFRTPIVSIMALFLLWAMFLNHVSPNHIGIKYNPINGTLEVQEQPGWYITSPWTLVMCTSTLPMRVHLITTARVMNTKLVRFRREGALDFVHRQGFGYMFPWRQELIMVGYAYSGEQLSFLEVIEDPTRPTMK